MGVEKLSLVMWENQDVSLIFIVLFGLFFLMGVFNKRTVIGMSSLLAGLGLTLMLSYGKDIQFKHLASQDKLSYEGQICKNIGINNATHTFLLDCADRKLKVRQIDVSIPRETAINL